MKHYSLLWSRFTFCVVEFFGENSFREQGQCLPSSGGCPQWQRLTLTLPDLLFAHELHHGRGPEEGLKTRPLSAT